MSGRTSQFVVTGLAALVVACAIVFLSMEIRHGTAALRAVAWQGAQGEIALVHRALFEPATRSAVIEGLNEPKSLGVDEGLVLFAWLDLVLQASQNLFLLVQSGTVDDAAASGWWQYLRNLFEYPGAQAHWQARRSVVNPEFRRFVEETLPAMPLQPGFSLVPGVSSM